MMTYRLYILSLLLFALACSPQKKHEEELARPNIVFFYADDLGYGDLGCFGAPKIKTPNIDKIAANGIKFTSFYSVSPVCSPSRAGLMTGRYPVRMGIHHVFFPESWTGLPVEEVTMANKLKELGYATGIVGKWHLGHHQRFLPLQRGFDEYFGIPYSNDMAGVVYLRGNDWVDDEVDQTQMVKVYTREAVDFIERHQSEAFFLYLPHNMPHVPIYASDDFLGTSDHGFYGDVIEEIDWGVGQVVEKLQELGLEENTIIVFSSDNGPWLTMIDHGGSAGILREGKGTTFEGGVRVPTVMQWKAKIKPGRVVDDVGTMMDWFPTFVSLLGGNLDDGRPIDGRDLSPVLLETGPRDGQDYAYWFLSRLQAYRSGDWKIKLPHEGVRGRYTYPGEPAHDTLLFNLAVDPGELNDLYSTHPEKVEELVKKLEAHREEIGPLPERLKNRVPADNSHGRHLREKFGDQ